MRGRQFGWKWGLLVGAPIAALPRSAFAFAARWRLRHVGFGRHAPAMRSSGWYGREPANRMTAAEGCPLPPPTGFGAESCPALPGVRAALVVLFFTLFRHVFPKIYRTRFSQCSVTAGWCCHALGAA